MREGITELDLPSSLRMRGNASCSAAGTTTTIVTRYTAKTYRRHLGLSVRQAHCECCGDSPLLSSPLCCLFAFVAIFCFVLLLFFVVVKKKSRVKISQLRVLSSASSACGRIGTTPLCFPPFQFLHTSHLDPILQSASPRCASRAGTGFTAASRWALGMGGGMNVWRA